MTQKIFISGMHSGQNPASGLGIARCLRQAFPDLYLVGVDHWQGSTGLNAPVLDEATLFPLWSQLDNSSRSRQVRKWLDDGHLWISATDLEVHWLNDHVGPHENLFAPTEHALEATSKPRVQAVTELESMGFRVPEYIPANLPDGEIHRFLRHNAWQCWLKSPYHDARRVTSWGVFERARAQLKQNWKTEKLFLQRTIFGHEETIAFASYRGELVDAAHLTKRQITPEGKTWAGSVQPLADDLREGLAQVMRDLKWNGGGEIEFIRDPDGVRWIIECNPRFPAWIFGGAISGINLPGKLMARALNREYRDTPARGAGFTRVVVEIPVQESIGLPWLSAQTASEWSIDGKKGKGGPSFGSFVPDLASQKEEEENARMEALLPPPDLPPPILWEDVRGLMKTFRGPTPHRAPLEGWLKQRFRVLSEKAKKASPNSPKIRVGYSVKTSPTDFHLAQAHENGFLAECISQAEVHRAIQVGFRRNEVILNGPGKFWPQDQEPVRGLHLVFADSFEEWESLLQDPKGPMAKGLGLRMRVPQVHSRFGNPLDDFENFDRIAKSLQKFPKDADLGFHFHMPSWAIGMRRWKEAFQSLLLWCQTLERVGGIPVRHLDLGGGHYPGDLPELDFPAIQEAVREALPSVGTLYFEPGRALTQDTEVLVSRVLDIRRSPDGSLREVVVDACVAELPLIHSHRHRTYFAARSAPPLGLPQTEVLEAGSVRILGRICMEDDILSPGVKLPDSVALGDCIVFGDAGGYERSMSYVFGRG